jgi:hypothetical protein
MQTKNWQLLALAGREGPGSAGWKRIHLAHRTFDANGAVAVPQIA